MNGHVSVADYKLVKLLESRLVKLVDLVQSLWSVAFSGRMTSSLRGW